LPKLLLALAGAAVVLTLSGCVVFFVQPSSKQNKVIGSVQVTITACASRTDSSPPTGSCRDNGNTPFQDASNGDQTQLLLGFLIPTVAQAPVSIGTTRTGPSNSGQLTFSRSASYTSELQRLDHAPAGLKWQGYISDLFTYTTAGEQNFTVSPTFDLPAHPGTPPFHGPFHYRPVVGARDWASGGSPNPQDAVDCDGRLTFGHPATGGQHWDYICADEPHWNTFDVVFLQPTRDAGVIPGPHTTAPAGRTAIVPFSFQYAGTATPAAHFTFTATTTVPGTAAKPSPPSLTPPSNSTKAVKASVALPLGTPPGTYSVTLKAALKNGQTRSGTGKLTVTPACKVPKLKGRSRRRATKALERAHCTLGKVTRRHSKRRRGRVIRQSPPAGTTLPGESPVAIVLSSGPKH